MERDYDNKSDTTMTKDSDVESQSSEYSEATSDETTDSTWEKETDNLVELILNECSEKEILEYFEENSPFDSNYSYRKWTPLHYATVKNRTDICRLLVQNGSNVNFMSKGVPWIFKDYLEMGKSPFQISCSRAVSLDIFELFIQNGGDVEKAWSGMIPLMYVVQEPELEGDDLYDIKEQKRKLQMILEREANVNANDLFGKNVLHHFDLYSENETEEEQVLEMMKSMIDCNVDTGKKDS